MFSQASCKPEEATFLLPFPWESNFAYSLIDIMMGSNAASSRHGSWSRMQRAHICRHKVWSRESRLNMATVFNLSKLTSGDSLPPARPHLLIPSKEHHQLSVQISESVGTFLFSYINDCDIHISRILKSFAFKSRCIDSEFLGNSNFLIGISLTLKW